MPKRSWVAAVVGVVCAVSPLLAGGPTTQPAERPEVIVDDAQATLAPGGKWNPSVRDKGFLGSGYHWCPKGDGEGTATWTAELPRPGQYNVYARWVMSKPDDRATNAPFTVHHRDGQTTIRVNMAMRQLAARPNPKRGNPWNLLGTFPFQKTGQVVLANDSDNSVVADAVRFEYMEPIGAPRPTKGEVLFQDDFDDLDRWVIEGSEGKAKVVDGRMKVVSTSLKKGVHAWFKPSLPDNVIVEYDMTIHGKKGFTLGFFCAHGAEGQDILTGDLPARDGVFGEYVGDPRFHCYHFSVHRHGPKGPVGGANLNRNPPKTLIQKNAVDPCSGFEGEKTFRITLVKMGRRIELHVDGERVLFCFDQAPEPYAGGKFGFRQIYLTEASYDIFRVYRAVMSERKDKS